MGLRGVRYLVQLLHSLYEIVHSANRGERGVPGPRHALCRSTRNVPRRPLLGIRHNGGYGHHASFRSE
jgi:hypothetical protein